MARVTCTVAAPKGAGLSRARGQAPGTVAPDSCPCMPAPGDLHTLNVPLLRKRLRPYTVLSILLVPIVAGAAANNEVIARVNATPISRKAVDDVVEATLAQEKQAPDAATARRLRAAALDSLIDFELLYQASIASGTVVAEAEIDQEVSLNKGRFPDDASFREALLRKGLTAEDLRFDTKRMIAVSRYLDRKIGRSVNVSAEDVGKFYQAHRAEFYRPAQVRASHILVRVEPGASEAQREAARAKANDLLAQIRGGARFAELARQYSEDRATAAEGGDLGFFSSGTMVESFEQPVFALVPGQVTGVFETPYGFHIAKVTDRTVEGTRSLDEVRDTIRAHLTQAERARLQAEHTTELRQRASIEIYDPTLVSPSRIEEPLP